MRFVGVLLTLMVLSGAVWWSLQTREDLRSLLEQYFDAGEFLTLEARFTPDQIMEAHKETMLKDELHRFLEPVMMFYPYLLMEVKYTTQDGETEEGMILWGLEDGEMVLDTNSWERTHGFQDCIRAGADAADFRIINTLASSRSAMGKGHIAKTLDMEEEEVAKLLEKAENKHLVVSKGQRYRLHFQNPKISVEPSTKMNQWLVTKPYKHALRVDRRYSISQIIDTTQAAFGKDFAIRSYKEVFLPVYSIEVQNPDNSIATYHWNALNGKPLPQRYVY